MVKPLSPEDRVKQIGNYKKQMASFVTPSFVIEKVNEYLLTAHPVIDRSSYGAFIRIDDSLLEEWYTEAIPDIDLNKVYWVDHLVKLYEKWDIILFPECIGFFHKSLQPSGVPYDSFLYNEKHYSWCTQWYKDTQKFPCFTDYILSHQDEVPITQAKMRELIESGEYVPKHFL